MRLLVVEARPVPEVAVLAEVLAVVGGDHDPGVRQHARVAEAGRGNGRARRRGRRGSRRTGRRGDGRRPRARAPSPGDARCRRRRAPGRPASRRLGLAIFLVGGGPLPEPPRRVGRRQVGAMHVHEIQEEEERTVAAGATSDLLPRSPSSRVALRRDQRRRLPVVRTGRRSAPAASIRLAHLQTAVPSDELLIAALKLISSRQG